MTKSELAKAIYKCSHLTGKFLLRSGQISHEYFDKYRFEAQPHLLSAIVEHLLPLLPKDIDAFAGLEMGGIPISTALSLKTQIPSVFVRKEAKSYGTKQLAEGLDVKGLRLCIIEDVVTTGGQVVTSATQLRDLGAHVEHVLCVIYRAQGKPDNLLSAGLQLKSLFTMNDL